MTALPISTKIAEGDTKEDGQRRFYGQIDIGPGDVQITAYESLGQDGAVIIDIDRGDAKDPEATPVAVAINDCYVDDTTGSKMPRYVRWDTHLVAEDMTRELFEQLPQILQCEPGDLGHWKHGEGTAEVQLNFTHGFPRANLETVAHVLRRKNITYRVENVERWTPER